MGGSAPYLVQTKGIYTSLRAHRKIAAEREDMTDHQGITRNAPDRKRK